MSNTTNQTPKRPVSTSAVVRIVLWSVVLVILTGLFALAMLQSTLGGLSLGLHPTIGGYHYDDADEYSVGGGTIQATVNEIDVDWLEGRVDILPTDGTAIEIEENYDGTSRDHQVRWRIEDGELSVKYRAPYGFFNFSKDDKPKKNLTILVPSTMLENMDEVSVESVEADVTFTGNARELSLDAVEGHMTVTGVIGELDMDAVEGSLTFRGSVDHLDLDGVEWDATVYLDRGSTIDLDGVETNMTLCLADTVTGFRLDANGLNCHNQINGFDSVRQDGDKNATWGDGSLSINMDGVSATLTVEKMNSQPVEPPATDTESPKSESAPAA